MINMLLAYRMACVGVKIYKTLDTAAHAAEVQNSFIAC
ncbi:MAG: hypothetical protein QG604_443 [Candidatus Dependentiae bacterium]|nr:hypothetical protein [Candidatus Dependentiae bacterium]MDQ5941131.1 hypothetical protein [Candidatus Dependentiae bacterium]